MLRDEYCESLVYLALFRASAEEMMYYVADKSSSITLEGGFYYSRHICTMPCALLTFSLMLTALAEHHDEIILATMMTMTVCSRCS